MTKMRNIAMIEVRMRHVTKAVGVRLCDWPATELDSVIPTIRRWGLADNDPDDLVAQFVVDHETHAAYFEIIFGDEADG
jgi:hypothetical protein